VCHWDNSADSALFNLALRTASIISARNRCNLQTTIYKCIARASERRAAEMNFLHLTDTISAAGSEAATASLQGSIVELINRNRDYATSLIRTSRYNDVS
jgi:hypothetical protein